MDMVKKGKSYHQKGAFDDNIDRYEQQKKLLHKPKLDTNLSGNLQSLQSREMDKLIHKHSPLKDKLTILKNLAQGYRVKSTNGNEQALTRMCDISLLRAQLLLDDI